MMQLTGYLPYAASNNVIMLFPQAAGFYNKGTLDGCWDWYGYTGKDYLTKQSVQGRAITKMVQRLQGVTEAGEKHWRQSHINDEAVGPSEETQ